MPCVAQLNSPADRLAALLAAIATQTEPVVTLTYLLQLCRHRSRGRPKRSAVIVVGAAGRQLSW